MATVNSVPGRLTGMCYTSPGERYSWCLSRTNTDCGIRVTAGYPEWKCSVGLISRVSQGPSMTNPALQIIHPPPTLAGKSCCRSAVAVLGAQEDTGPAGFLTTQEAGFEFHQNRFTFCTTIGICGTYSVL